MLVEVGCRLRDDGMIGREASLVKSDLGDFEPIGWSGSNAWVPVVQTTCEKIGPWSCGREARECGQAEELVAMVRRNLGPFANFKRAHVLGEVL